MQVMEKQNKKRSKQDSFNLIIELRKEISREQRGTDINDIKEDVSDINAVQKTQALLIEDILDILEEYVEQ